jgi:hypothetical protein
VIADLESFLMTPEQLERIQLLIGDLRAVLLALPNLQENNEPFEDCLDLDE